MTDAPPTTTSAGVGSHDPCACGVCGSDVPPLVGTMLTGVGLTLDAAAKRLLAGDPLPSMSDVQRRIVEAHVERAPAPRADRSSSRSQRPISQM